MKTLTIYYSSAYCVDGSAHDTLRKASWVAASLTRRPIAGVVLGEPRPLDSEELLTVHTEEYVEAVLTGKPRWQAQSQGFEWCEALYPAAAASSGGAVAAALHALENGTVAGSLSSGLHHARADVGEGYCTFNGLALAARAAVAAGASRVLILDFDAHGGGGTWSLLSGDPAFSCLDISTYDFDRFPNTRGWRSVLVSKADRYGSTIEKELRAIEEPSSFDLCLYNAGMDPCELSDQGLPGLRQGALAQREQLVFQWARAAGLPVAFVLAGGYLSSRLDRGGLIALHRETVQRAAGVLGQRKEGPESGTEGTWVRATTARPPPAA